MNQSTRTNPVAGIIAVVDVVLVFLMGILGNNISGEAATSQRPYY